MSQQDQHPPEPNLPARAGLTPVERELLSSAFANGPQAFIDAGMSQGEAQEFINRADVRAEIDALSVEFSDFAAITRRREFIAKQRLGAMMPAALQILSDSLKGPQYARVSHTGAVRHDEKGHLVLMEPEPTAAQRSAASEVLDRLGIQKTDATKVNGLVLNGVEVRLDYRKTETPRVIDYDPEASTPIRQAQSRDRRRKAMEALMEFIPELSQVVKHRSESAVNHRTRAVKSKTLATKKNGKAK